MVGRAGILGMVGLLFGTAPLPAQPATSGPDEIVVTASRNKCRYRLADRAISEAELEGRAKDWVGRPLRIVLAEAAGRACMIKIGMRLANRGVREMEFVEPSDDR